MNKKLTKLIGLKKSEFDNFVAEGALTLRKAHLIPTLKVGDEMALTSILLSAVRLIKEFRYHLLNDLKMIKGGKIFTYTEVEFSEFQNIHLLLVENILSI